MNDIFAVRRNLYISLTSGLQMETNLHSLLLPLGKEAYVVPFTSFASTFLCVDLPFSPFLLSGVGQGGGRPGEKGAGGVQEAGEEGAGSGIPKVAGSGRKREKLRNIAQYFAIKKMQRGRSQKIQGGNRD